ncbi:short transient receptor potential channel 2-like isoform X3 [Orbicella faveolata]|uniref:short transient receptor potential channel 2-like isoform X3 n=1 Tax=Orbicella faveolata TaxID=48498 RepID=UPI0009E2CC96|nr:short transient receptor potential channel 2-like isoform X3 [Orbicella faveolata]
MEINYFHLDRARNEKLLMKLLSEKNSFDAIKKKITPKALTNCVSNSLLMAMKVNYRLRSLAKSKGSEGEMFNKLADSVEDFTTRLLDPMQSDQSQRYGFGHFILDDILDDAIDLEQKKFFTHPVVHSEMTRKWRGRVLMTINIGKWTWFFLHIWCLFEMVLAPITFYCVSYLTDTSGIGGSDRGTGEPRIENGRNLQCIKRLTSRDERYPKVKLYLEYLKTPYFIFVRDTLSYVALLGLHYAFCLSPSSLAFSGLEWSILIFFIGRSLVEFEQIRLIIKRIKGRREREKDETNSNVLEKALSIYISDRWNKIDVVSVVTYLVIFVLRLTTWITSESVTNNRAVLVASYLYSFNTLCIALRIGHFVETFKGLGTIQIALCNVFQDVFTIVWQFIASVFAFSVAITKIYMAEKSFHASASNQQNLVCKTAGVSCFWEILTHLSWSLLEIEQDSNPLNSVDTPSVALAKLLYAVFLFIAVILLVNMLIALLSHTYQRVRDNALKEWSYKKAVTIQTYESYNPIHAPLNIISELFLLHWWDKKKERRDKKNIRRRHDQKSKMLFQHLEAKYFAKHGNLFPVTDEKKLDEVYLETERNRQMLTQILLRTVNNQNFDLRSRDIDPQEWDVDRGINVNGNVLTCEGVEDYKTEADPDKWVFGARYTHPLCPEFPHFEKQE